MIKRALQNLIERLFDWITLPTDLKGSIPTLLALNIINFTRHTTAKLRKTAARFKL